MLTHGKLSDWLTKGCLLLAILSTCYSILYKIGIYNWLPRTLKSTMTKTFDSLLFLIRTKQSFNLGHMMFDHILRHAELEAHKLGIGYLSIIFGIPHSQHPTILSHSDSFSGPPSASRLNYKLFQWKHKSDILLGKKASMHTLSSNDSPFCLPSYLYRCRTIFQCSSVGPWP